MPDSTGTMTVPQVPQNGASTRPIIDPEFRDLLTPLADDERQRLEAKLVGEGSLKPVIVWKEENIVIDGHHSLAIYDKHKIPFTFHYLSFPSREAAIKWAIDNQLGRRNLTDERKAYYQGKKYLNHKQAHGASERFSEKSDQNPGDSASAHSEHLGATAENIGSDDGASQATVRRNAAFAHGVDQLSPQAKEKVLSGKSGVSRSQVAAGALCSRCKRVGPTNGCGDCARIKETAERKRAKANADKGDAWEHDPDEDLKVPLMDLEGNPVPKGLRDIFKTRLVEDTVQLIETAIANIKAFAGMSKFVLARKILDEFEEAQAHLMANIPYAVHDTCAGKGCNGCRHGGWLPKWRWEEDQV